MAELAVIMPAYNASKTIERTIKSVLAQTFADLELWIVDDGSTDDTQRIADEYAKRDARVHVIHQQNSKAYYARVNALRQSNTPYFGFIDADDVIDPSMYEKLLVYAKENDLEIAQCDIVGEGRPKTPELFLSRKAVIDNVIRPYLIEGVDSLFVWDKIYKHKLSKGLTDSHIMMFDDMMLHLHFLRNVTRYGHLHEELYHYDINAGSSVRNFRLSNVEDFKEIIRARREGLGFFGVSRDDIVHDRWIVMNARNMIISASSAPAESWKVRLTNVRSLLELKDFRESLGRLVVAGDRRARRLNLICRMPDSFIAAFYKTIKSAQRVLRKL